MSYYSRPTYEFSYHGLQRCKERLNLKNRPDYEVKEEVYKLIKNSLSFFETRSYYYISAGKTRTYFVISRSNNLIITCTNISVEKQLSLLLNEGI